MTPSPDALTVLGLAGSLRQGSFNRSLLRAARDLTPKGLRLVIADLHEVPLYNGDLDLDDRRPTAVTALKAAIDAADALLIATPEYNHGIPGVLKNALDWASRKPSALTGKPVAIMGASPGLLGTARAQQALKLVLLATGTRPMPHTGLVVGHVRDKFNADGHLTDEATQDRLRRLLDDLATWTQHQQQARGVE